MRWLRETDAIFINTSVNKYTNTMCIYFIILVMFNAALGANQWRCDYNYHTTGNGWFKFHDVSRTWQEAYLRCHYEGAKLASPTPELIDTMIEIIKKKNIPSRKIYIGIHGTFFDREFSTVEGVPLPDIPHKWATGEPDNNNNEENCLTMNLNGALADDNCKSNYQFICYRKDDKPQLNSCGTSDNEYTMDSRTGSCYKFHRHPHSWHRAYMVCNAEGGYLAVINSETEAQVIRDILARNPENTLPPRAFEGSAIIGYRDMDEHGTWLTVQGQTLKEAGYDRFSQGQPDNNVGRQFCGHVFRTGLLDDGDCASLIPFICEKDPGSLICNYV